MSKSTEVLDRRQFLIRLGGASAAIAVVGAGLATVLKRGSAVEVSDAGSDPASAPDLPPVVLPERDPVFEDVAGVRPEYTPLDQHYRVDINLAPAVVAEQGYSLRVFGLVENELALSLDEIRSRWEPVSRIVTLACISNPIAGDLIGTTQWTGVPFHKVLDAAGVRPGAQRAIIRGADGFDEVIELDLVYGDERVMLTYAWDGRPLEVKHGFPLRIYIPDRYGMKQPKWITEIELVDSPYEGYWVRRSWDEDAIMLLTSVIDNVDLDGIYERDGQSFVPIGGMVFAGAKGISAVEVRVDDGEWQPAQLRPALSDTSWALWRFDWPFSDGQHRFFVRAFDGAGEPQATERTDPYPSGARGIHSRVTG